MLPQPNIPRSCSSPCHVIGLEGFPSNPQILPPSVSHSHIGLEPSLAHTPSLGELPQSSRVCLDLGHELLLMDVVTVPGMTDAFKARTHCSPKRRLRKHLQARCYLLCPLKKSQAGHLQLRIGAFTMGLLSAKP